MSNENEKIKLLLGDIIKIYSPSNNELHEKQFYIDYIDSTKIKLLSQDDEKIINLDERGYFNDQSIIRVEILYRNDKIGFVQQNGLFVDKWINIHYIQNDLPEIIKGTIVDNEEDMIKIKTHPNDEYIFIDFAYKGIPEEYNISKIEVRDLPPILTSDKKTTVDEDVEDVEDVKEEDQDDNVDIEDKERTKLVDANYELEEGEIINNELDVDNTREIIDNELREIEDFNIGANLGRIKQYEKLDIEKRRYGLDIQINDFVENIANSLKNKNNRKDIDNINKLVDRFIELRNDFSIMDENKNPIKIKKHSEDFKPLVEKIKSNDFSWIKPITQIQKNIYDSVKKDDKNDDEQDVFKLKLSDVRSQEYELYQNYNSTNSENKYKEYNRKYDKFTIPFRIPINTENLFSITTNGKHEAIVKNYGDFETSIFSENNEIYKNTGINSTKMFTQVYISGLTYPSRKNQMIDNTTKLLPLTENDDMYVSSYLGLPINYGEIKRSYLPQTNIYNKIKNNIYQYPLSIDLKKMKILSDEVNETLDWEYNKAFEYNWNKFNENTDNFDKYLQSFLPNIDSIYKNSYKSNTNISLNYIINELAPYGVDNDDLLYENYVEFRKSISKRQKSYFDFFKSRRRNFNYYNKNISVYEPSKNILFLTPNIETEKMENLKLLYVVTDNKSLTNGEFIKLMNNTDCSKLLQIMFSNEFISLKNSEIENIISKRENVEASDNKKCNDIIIAKKYYNKNNLLKDNNKKIYFDKKLDDTPYDIINNYKREQNTMKENEFLDFFSKKLQDVNGLTEDNSINVAKTMIEGRKVVKNNHYAILYVENETNDEKDIDENKKLEYYKRIVDNENNQELWQLDEEVTKNKEKKFELMLENNCDDDLECFQNVNNLNDVSCIDDDNKLKKVNNDLLKEMEIEFYKKYYEVIDNNNEYFENYKLRLNSLQKYIMRNNEKYNRYYLKISKNIEEQEIVISPYKKKLDEIFSKNNMQERYELLLLFANKYTRTALLKEDKHFLYCIETNTELLPGFYVKLANAYLKKQNYRKVLDEIAQLYGDYDGNLIVDRISGYEIRPRDFDEDQGYDDMGFKVVTNDIIIDDNDDIDIETNNQEIDFILYNIIDYKNSIEETKQEELKDNNEIIFIKETVTMLENYLKINIGNLKQFITQKTLFFYEKYNKNKVNDTKSSSVKYTIFMLTVCLFLLSLQLIYPKIKIKKQFLGVQFH